jgi:hypothetical protein
VPLQAVRLPGDGRLDHQRFKAACRACQADLDVLLNDAPARMPPDSSTRIEI